MYVRTCGRCQAGIARQARVKHARACILGGAAPPPRHAGEGLMNERARPSALATAVRQRRRELGLRQEELADLAGTSQRFVHTVEAGKPSIQLDKLLAVLGALGLGLAIVEGDGRLVGDARSSPAP